MDEELQKWLQLPVVGPTLTAQAVMVRLPDNTLRLRYILYKDGEPIDIMQDPTNAPNFNLMRACARTVERGMAEADMGMRIYSFEILTTPSTEVPGGLKIDVKTTLPDQEFNEKDPLQPLMATVGQYAIDLLKMLMRKDSNAQINETLRPPGHIDGDPSKQAGRSDPEAQSGAGTTPG